MDSIHDGEPVKVLRVLSGGAYGEVGHALVDGKVLCGGLQMFYMDPGDEGFSRQHDCRRCLRSLRRLERDAAMTEKRNSNG